MTDGNVPFLTQLFFFCGSNEDCAKVLKTKESTELNKETHSQQAAEENELVFKKVQAPKPKD